MIIAQRQHAGIKVPLAERMQRSLTACLLALAGFAAPSRAHAQIAIDRESVLLNPADPSERSATIVVRNTGATDVQALVRLEDWDLDARGASHWQKPGQVAGSCGNRVSVSPHTLKLAPGEQRTVHIAVEGRAHFEAECWSAAVVQPIGIPSAAVTPADSASEALRTRATIPLYVTPSGLAVDGELQNMYVKGDSLEMVYANTGKVRTDVVGEVQVRISDDSVVTRVPIEQTTVLAGATRKFRVAMPKLPKGKYVLYAIVDFGGTQMTAVQAALEIQ
jgi:P pilus assembly chaperone PapD